MSSSSPMFGSGSVHKSYQVYRVATVGLPLDHQVIFVETDANGGGTRFHVTGNIQEGMTYQTDESIKPELVPEFVSKTHLGWMHASSFHHFDSVCKTVPVPKKQFNGPRRLFPNEPLRRCTEWADEATEALILDGVLRTATESMPEATNTSNVQGSGSAS